MGISLTKFLNLMKLLLEVQYHPGMVGSGIGMCGYNVLFEWDKIVFQKWDYFGTTIQIRNTHLSTPFNSSVLSTSKNITHLVGTRSDGEEFQYLINIKNCIPLRYDIQEDEYFQLSTVYDLKYSEEDIQCVTDMHLNYIETDTEIHIANLDKALRNVTEEEYEELFRYFNNKLQEKDKK